MNEHSDSWDEMHDDSLSPEETERLISGTSDRPELADLAALMASVRALPKTVDTPAVSAALSEFVGVDLTNIPEPVVLLDAEVAEAMDVSTSPQAEPVRRNTMIGQLAAFVGTLGGKVAVCATVAAASIGGAHATGAVDVPFLPDTDATEIETVDLPEDPDALAFVDDEVDEAKEDVEEPENNETDDEEEEEKKEEKESDEKDSYDTESDYDIESDDEKDSYDIESDDYPEHELDEKKAEEPEEEPTQEPKKVEEPKKKEEPKTEPKREEPKEQADDKSEAQQAAEALIAALEEEVHAAKDAVRAEATALINPLEEERDGLLEQLEAAHIAIDDEWEAVIASLIGDLEGTEGELDRAAIEEQIDAAEQAWVAARVAAELEVDPRLNEINELFEVIETERDAEIDRLLNEFLEAVEEIQISI
jgi:hypothetical protein